jgi:hypothetical protein
VELEIDEWDGWVGRQWRVSWNFNLESLKHEKKLKKNVREGEFKEQFLVLVKFSLSFTLGHSRFKH